MTATEVNGLAVVSDEPQEAAFRDRLGNPIYLRQTRVLTLADGTLVYGCATCDYTSANPHSIRPHLNKHSRRAGANRRTPELPLSEFVERLEHLAALEAERDEWKTRAREAERRLKQLRTAIGVAP